MTKQIIPEGAAPGWEFDTRLVAHVVGTAATGARVTGYLLTTARGSDGELSGLIGTDNGERARATWCDLETVMVVVR